MLDQIIIFSIRNKVVIAILTLAIVIWGVWSTTKLAVDAVPDITNNQVQIITTAPTLATQEVEQFITYPVEKSVSNIPGLLEIRSISRFGLSVITVVFRDDVDIYFARQLIAEQLREVEEQIPKGMGRPEMAPVSSGLGEVYQYMIAPKEGSEGKYSSMDLRTMQDWIVARQLYGTPGVAEVNSFGGHVKQYEVAVDPNRLKSLNVTIPEIFDALSKNNQNTGGAYIDKKPNAYFIRAIGLVSSLDDIGKIVVKNTSGIPVFISDVATVRFGSAIRYGAMTHNGEREIVGGIVMMLKGSNSAQVVARVKERLETIKRSLPEDVVVKPFLDRTTLVKRAMSTVEKNLIEGALIVIFVLVLFLGNLRAGLIVTSAIPLSMLFALGLMNVFGVSANLMSLGAIDFGLIVDGAVIIVEATLHHLSKRAVERELTQAEMDNEVFEASSKIRNSASFGEIIILIVYIPILTLVGIEGKTFRPMAETVSFAILGALLLSLTYIPVMCSLFLPKMISHKRTISDRMMDFFQRIYAPVIRWAIRTKRLIVAVSLALLAVTVFAFARMGGEFIPQLQEGDFAFHCILPQGSSLSQSIETSMQASRIIKQFPEVKEVIGKTGSAEVPTDPMPPEASDLIIVLKDKKHWTTTDNYKDLAEMMMKKLEGIPGVFFEANQPIQMRFNELMTGVRQDVAVKVFGENMDTLAALGTRISNLIQSVEGASAPQIERTAGLPQITVTYDRGRMASYGLTIDDVNSVVSTAFAGQSAGSVFENEQKFDLVVRMDSAYRSSIENVADLFIPVANGTQVPLSQVATIAFKEGPAQISREDAKRRLVIGFNVGNRDVRSVVTEIQEGLNTAAWLPTGYYVTYGGTFENLEKASARLRIAVPGALLLIFVLLYFTFNSAKQAALIFTAIPMSAIGGVFALLIRGMPFSISAGVGFIALFGVAVLNGIVLLGTFRDLEKEGIDDVTERVLEGTKIRLRPVLMTALVASLGFLPMALSSGAGAEVQKPLATVVIGGLVTATLLTLIVIPVLYILVTRRTRFLKRLLARRVGVVIVLLALPFLSKAQTITPPNYITFHAAFDTALRNNLLIQSNDLQVARSNSMRGSWLELPKTGVFIENEDITPEAGNGVLKIGLSQAIELPSVYKARRNLLQQQAGLAEQNRALRIAEIRRETQVTYYTLWYFQSKQILWHRLDSVYTSLAHAAVLRVKTGESAGLDSISAKARSQEIRMQLNILKRDIITQQEALKKFTGTTVAYLPEPRLMEKIDIVLATDSLQGHPALLLQRQQVGVAAAELTVQKQSWKPTFEGRFFSQRLYGITPPFSGYSVSVGVPLFGRSAVRSKIKSAEIERSYQEKLLAYEQVSLVTAYNQGVQELQKNGDLLNFYESTGLRQAEAILKASNIAYRAGEISFAELSQFLTQAIDIQKDHLDALHQYNQSAIQLTYFLNR